MDPDEKELTGALMNALPMPDYTTERENLMMFPHKTFDDVVEICRKTTLFLKSSSTTLGTSAYYSQVPTFTSVAVTSPPTAPSYPIVSEIAEATATAHANVLDLII